MIENINVFIKIEVIANIKDKMECVITEMIFNLVNYGRSKIDLINKCIIGNFINLCFSISTVVCKGGKVIGG
ncbi:hypothetical protein VH58_11020 [Helicobacter pylori]